MCLAEEALDAQLLSTVMLVLLKSLVRQNGNTFLYEQDRAVFGREATQVFYRLSDLSKIEEVSGGVASETSLKSVLESVLKKNAAWASTFLANGARALRTKLPRELEDQIRAAFKLPPIDANIRGTTSASQCTEAMSAPSTASSSKRGGSREAHMSPKVRPCITRRQSSSRARHPGGSR